MKFAVNLVAEKERKNSLTIPSKNAKFQQDLPLLAESKPMDKDITQFKNSSPQVPQAYGFVR